MHGYKLIYVIKNMKISENIFHKLISYTINENEINTVRFKN